MSFFDFVTDVITAPITLPIKAVEYGIKAVESVPNIVESSLEKIEEALDKVGS